LLTNFALLGSSRLGSAIRIVALQGMVLSALPLSAHEGGLTGRLVLLAVGSFIVKGAVFPRLLFRALRLAEVRREVEPYVSYIPSILAGIAALGGAFWMGSRVTLPGSAASRLVFPAALFMIFVGLFLTVARRQALMQVLGFLVLENGIYTFGVMLVGEIPMLIELGVLLDVFVAVLVMGIAVYHISREFDPKAESSRE
jgi:hydrogenase-4 component E